MATINISKITIGEEYKYKDLCGLIEEDIIDASNTPKRNKQFEKWRCYFNIEKIGIGCKTKFVINEIYDEPLPVLDNGYFYKTILIPVNCNRTDYKYLLQCNKWSAECWNALVKADKEYYEQNKKCMTRSQLQTFVKGITPLHAAGNQHVYLEYYTSRDAMFRSIKAKHENSSKVKLPYKEKKYFVTGWNPQSSRIDYDNKKIYLTKAKDSSGKNQSPVCCKFKNCPRYVAEIELVWRNKLYLAIKYKSPKTEVEITDKNVAAIDLGEIHSITSIDNNGNAIIITGRKLRSIRRLHDKELGKLYEKLSHCEKRSNQYKKYMNAISKLSLKTDRQVLDCVHKITKLYEDYCVKNGISKVYYGDLDSCTRDTKERANKLVGQKLNNWNYGELTSQLENKLSRHGIELVKVSEAYSSQTCPHCGEKHKPTNRNYKCKCGYEMHRDIVGAMNILNFNEEGIHIEKYKEMKYLRIE